MITRFIWARKTTIGGGAAVAVGIALFAAAALNPGREMLLASLASTLVIAGAMLVILEASRAATRRDMAELSDRFMMLAAAGAAEGLRTAVDQAFGPGSPWRQDLFDEAASAMAAELVATLRRLDQVQQQIDQLRGRP